MGYERRKMLRKKWKYIQCGCISIVASFFLGSGCGKTAEPGDGFKDSVSLLKSVEIAGSALTEEAVSYEYLGYEDGMLQIEMANNTDDEIEYSDDH